MKIAVKEVGKTLQIIETSKKYRSDCCQEFTGKDDPVEYVRLSKDGTISLAVNENGLPLDLPLNFLMEMDNPHFPIQKMVGAVVFVRCKYANPYIEEIWDYEVEDLTEHDIKLINMMLDDEYQDSLKQKFKDYGKGAVFYNFFEGM